MAAFVAPMGAMRLITSGTDQFAIGPRACPLRSRQCRAGAARASDDATTPYTAEPSRRALLAGGAAALAAAALPPPSLAADELVPFSSPNGAYSLLRPAGWEQKSKMGADVLFDGPSGSRASLGVTVLPVRVPSLEAFGSLDDVGEKLLAAEREKESTLGVAMVSAAARTAPFGTVYDFVYELDSTRGRKQLVNAVTIVDSKLYIVNGAVGCGKVEACSPDVAAFTALVTRAAQSLDVARKN
jgi:hypothetical protein